MKNWEERFFALNRASEMELVGVPFKHVLHALKVLGWSKDDQFWAPDLQVCRFLRHEQEIFLIEETYFDPKLTGTGWLIDELREFISQIDPDEIRQGSFGKMIQEAVKSASDPARPRKSPVHLLLLHTYELFPRRFHRHHLKPR